MKALQDQYLSILDNLPDAFVFHEIVLSDDDGHPAYVFLRVNKAFERISGIRKEEILHRNVTEAFASFRDFTFDWTGTYDKMAQDGDYIRFEQYFPQRSLWLEITVCNHHNHFILTIFRDITSRKKAEEVVGDPEYLFYDQMTGVYNRRFLETELKRLNTRRNYPIALATITVGDHQEIRGTYGKGDRDKFLQKVALIIKKECRADDIIARTGANEFMILLPKTSSDQADRLVERIHVLIDQEIGVVFYEQPQTNDGVEADHNALEVIRNILYQKNDWEESEGKKVADFCLATASALGMPEGGTELEMAGLFRNIGYISIDDSILNKPASLTPAEWKEIRCHPEIGFRLLKCLSGYAGLAEIVRDHHERWDGEGYPRKLSGEAIPLPARIIAVADAYVAMTSDRPFRKARKEAEAVKEIAVHAGTQFDEQVARVFVQKVLGREWPE
jgi:diguanylate cyclase (GGDEF)-like protein/PAS domain S-box-containing protein